MATYKVTRATSETIEVEADTADKALYLARQYENQYNWSPEKHSWLVEEL